MVFVELKHILPKEILEDNNLAVLNLILALDGKKAAHAIISHFYKLNTQIRPK